VVLIYLDHDVEAVKAKCRASEMMTVVAIMASLLPILWGTGTGSEVMRRIATDDRRDDFVDRTDPGGDSCAEALVKQWRSGKVWNGK
jgi:hypothetical protein